MKRYLKYCRFCKAIGVKPYGFLKFTIERWFDFNVPLFRL